MYYKRLLTVCGVVQLSCGISSLLLFLLEWKLFGLLIPIYAVGVAHIFCGAWCLVEIYRKATITATLYTSGACISAVAVVVSVTLIAVSSVDLRDANSFAQIYRTSSKDSLFQDVDHAQVLIAFGFAYLVIGLLAIGAAATQFLLCIIRLLRNSDGIALPTRILEARINNDLRRDSDVATPYAKMHNEDDETTI